jgi:hypothetical protein
VGSLQELVGHADCFPPPEQRMTDTSVALPPFPGTVSCAELPSELAARKVAQQMGGNAQQKVESNPRNRRRDRRAW